MLEIIKSLRWQDVVDIMVVAFIIYHIILLIRGTRAMQMLVGIVFIIVLYFLARELELLTLYWLLGTILSSLFLIIIIIFQRDIRRVLTQVGQTPFTKPHTEAVQVIEEVLAAVRTLSRRKTGALIVLERETGLKDYVESSHPVESRLSKEVLISLFLPDSPLHDGGIIIKDGSILSARCMLPLSKNPYISKQLGTRHRAAIGLSEETDAVIVVVSEETGRISIVQHGAITSGLDEATLRSRLDAIFTPKEHQPQLLWKNWLNRF